MTSFLSSIGKKKKTPEQLVLAVKESLQRLIDGSASFTDEKKFDDERNQLLQSIGKALVDMKNILYGDHDSSSSTTISVPTQPQSQLGNLPSANTAASANTATTSASATISTITPIHLEEEKIRELSVCLQSENVLIELIQSLALISFESRKDTTLIYTNLLKKNVSSFAQYIIADHLSLIRFLIEGYNNAEIAFHCGIMIRESIKYHEVLRFILLTHPHELVWPFIDHYLHLPNFDIASDGFNTFKEFFNASLAPPTNNSSTTPSNSGSSSSSISAVNSAIGTGSLMNSDQALAQKQIVNEFFEVYGTEFLSKYEILLRSENYVTRRRSLKLLGELLLDRSHYSLMIKYVSSTTNLKTVMHLLRNRSPHITFETFHIFKIFVANPNKPPEIASILFNNKVKLIAYLENFQNERQDSQFIEEKRLLIETLQQLNDPYEHIENRNRSDEKGLFSRENSRKEDITIVPFNEIESLSFTDSNQEQRENDTNQR